ncbi:MAG: heat-inducible transcription repressor HrcA [Deltaproteobacteria bacterium]|nr:heat-inducible transcription repressor HrcA [Deltaproteobacteria bacterium]
MFEELSERARKILEAIIEDFIETGEPVGSRSITRRHKMNLSPATVRNVMADLEEGGYLYSPHTSAGRIPTEKGYRFYVDSLAHFREPGAQLEKEFESGAFLDGLGLGERLQRAGRILSASSSYAGIVSAPSFDATVFRHIEFVKLSEQKILAVLVSRSGSVQNKVIDCRETITGSELEKITNFVNSRLTGLTIREVKNVILREMAQDKALYDTLCQRAFQLSQKAFEDHPEGEVFIEGASNILEQPEFASLERMKKLFRAFEQKSLLVKLLDQCRNTDGFRVLIGSEFEFLELEGCSLVTSTYTSASGISGILGVLGPSRMPYSVVIPLVYQTGRLVGRFLEQE